MRWRDIEIDKEEREERRGERVVEGEEKRERRGMEKQEGGRSGREVEAGRR